MLLIHVINIIWDKNICRLSLIFLICLPSKKFVFNIIINYFSAEQTHRHEIKKQKKAEEVRRMQKNEMSMLEVKETFFILSWLYISSWIICSIPEICVLCLMSFTELYV